jgi:hypothetical protein
LPECIVVATTSSTKTIITYPIDLPRLLRVGGQRCGEQSEDKGTNKPDGPEPHNGLLYCYEGTNITGERVVNRDETQLNDALIAFWTVKLSASYTVAYLITLVA